MLELLQFVDTSFLEEGQGKRAWWTVEGQENGYTIVRRGQQTKRLSYGDTVLQKPFKNL